ncbi:P-loop containing nucleoside triphosphate hydrolase protein [Mycena alexandri]|uniref:P-loop containing nucleoside triphosphate hydrolase protein n=1 Tax=Mycena alexandri TaxID=1745969 RepID=A0AAD6WRU4_9AGAR|nr:P-loop containing nucleoside triphosphate hydrolase protein [Mycena alexandri]
MLPAEPKIFHGRDAELADILKLFGQGSLRIAILGAGGMGKTSLARTVLHRVEITAKYHENRFFVACDTTSSKVELAGLIGAHLGIKPGKDLTQGVLQHFSNSPPSLLILDNLETLWEPVESRNEVEEFLSHLTDIPGVALMITMRGAERPSKVLWTHPFLPPLGPLAKDAAKEMFFDIADAKHLMQEVDQILGLTDNVPLAISLLAHLVDTEGCSRILSRWETEKISLLSEGYDKKSNLELSISLSLSSPRITSIRGTQDLLALLSILPDGLSDVELKQSKFPVEDILGCKVALLRTTLAYTDEHKRLKVLVPIREYMQKLLPASNKMIRPLFKHFKELLEVWGGHAGKQTGSLVVSRVKSNFGNIQNIVQKGLYLGHPNLIDSGRFACLLNQFNRVINHGDVIPLLHHIISMLPQLCDHQLEMHIIIEVLTSWCSANSSSKDLIIRGHELIHHVDADLKGMFFT